MKNIFLLICLTFSLSILNAQDMNWRQSAKAAEEMYKQGKYGEAAELYMQAYKLKERNDFLYFAGESHYRQRDYRKAARAFRKIKNDKNFPLAELLYARCLKQDTHYEAAQKALVDFMAGYKGKDKSKLKSIVENEIEGCVLGLKEIENSSEGITIEMLSENINTVASEFSPIPFADDVLYFSSTMEEGKARIYRSQRKAGNWSEAIKPNFPEMPAGHFCNGSFSPDTRRFYFTICKEDRSWGGAYSECDIYVTWLNDNSWSAPEKLRDYIKMDGSTATHPFVAHLDGKEVLYYSTNRKGGQGGLDIWYTSRSLDSDEMDFILPQNAGTQINTAGDEVTPYYDTVDGVLYFSSNGHVNIGGYDIYRARGSEESWSTAQRLQGSYNSYADDYYYVPPSSKNSGFFVSNRLFGLEKISTLQDDIFTFYPQQQSLLISGKVFNKSSNNLMIGAEVSLYELRENDTERLLTSWFVKDGYYTLSLMPEKKFMIEISKEDFATESYEFDTYAQHNKGVSLSYDFYLEKRSSAITASDTRSVQQDLSSEKTAVSEKPIESMDKVDAKPKAENASSETDVTAQHTENVVAREVGLPKLRWSYTPKHSGVYYKIQCKAVVEFDPQEPALIQVAKLGRLDTEYMIGKGLTRILLAEFFTLNDALAAVEKVRKMGFPDAFLVKYRDGDRLTP